VSRNARPRRVVTERAERAEREQRKQDQRNPPIAAPPNRGLVFSGGALPLVSSGMKFMPSRGTSGGGLRRRRGLLLI